MNITTEYPIWFVFFCRICGAVYAALLYFREKDKGLYDEFPWVKYLLPVIRGTAVSFIAFFLLGPLLSSFDYFKEKPILMVAYDHSGSINSWDSSFDQRFKAMAEKLDEELGDKFQLDYVQFGEDVETGKNWDAEPQASSNLSSVLNYSSRAYENQNYAASILLTDAIYNAGSDPLFAADAAISPVYAVGLGDTTIRTDIRFNNVLHNSIAYLGNEFPVRAEIKATKLQGKQATLSVYNNGARVSTESIVIDNNEYYAEKDFRLKATALGAMKVELQLTVFEGELNTINNRAQFYVDVVDSRKKVEIWAKAPHPDIGALRTLIDKNENYQCQLRIGSSAQEVSDDLDLVVLHNWFEDGNDLQLFEALKSKGIGVWLVIGNRFNPSLFNQGSQDLKFNRLGRGDNAAQALTNSAFEYFDTDESLSENVQSWSPLRVPFGKFSGYKKTDVVLYQKIGAVKTDEPLLLVQQNQNHRFACLSGTGFWQWKLLDFEANNNHELSSELVQHIIQYVSVKDNKKRLKVYPREKNYSVSDAVILAGELYNQSLQAVANAEINVTILSEDGTETKRLMDPVDDQYRLRLQNLPAGSYTFTARTSVGGQELLDKGYFTIQEQQIEQTDLTANHQLLRGIAQKTGGLFFNLDQWDELLNTLKNEETMVAQISEERSLNELINKTALFWLILGLLTAEWFLRKIIGNY
ncbi:hypothetical protein GYB29_13045 [bacterium]|nr:hypothetical protein [bacterium]